VVPSATQVVLYLCTLPLGLAIHYAVLFGLATASFWIVRAQGLIYGYFNVFNIARYPDAVFRGIFRVIFSYVIPVILVANVPTRVIGRAFETPWAGVAQLAVVSIAVLLASRLFWRFALTRYSSASS
jgi:ABC-2 type transport system permease protein